jgi:SAM-dependent methyltransferase
MMDAHLDAIGRTCDDSSGPGLFTKLVEADEFPTVNHAIAVDAQIRKEERPIADKDRPRYSGNRLSVRQTSHGSIVSEHPIDRVEFHVRAATNRSVSATRLRCGHTGAMRLDWSLGHYETIGEQLRPVSAAVVERAAVSPGDRVVDVGCGTGNAAILAALRGAHVTGVDPAARLLEVARVRAAESGASATFVQGDAASIPLETASADLLLSVFGVIFAPDVAAAAAEIARVTAPGGRIILTAWIPAGGINDCVAVFQKAVAAAIGMPPGPPPFAWHEQNALASLFGPHGFAVTVEPGQVAFTATSAREYLEVQGRDHPMSVAGQALLESRGGADMVGERALGILEAANEAEGSFKVTSRYVMAIAVRTNERV